MSDAEKWALAQLREKNFFNDPEWSTKQVLGIGDNYRVTKDGLEPMTIQESLMIRDSDYETITEHLSPEEIIERFKKKL